MTTKYNNLLSVAINTSSTIERSDEVMSKEVIMPILKAGVAVAAVGITLAQNWFNKKDMDDTIAKKVAEALEKNKES